MADDITTSTITYEASGTSLRGFLAHPSGPGPFPGVMVVHEWWGLDDNIRERARRVARLGYTALALDMYGDGTVAADAGEANALMSAVLGDMDSGTARLDAAYAALADHPTTDATRIGAIGYCFGGAMVLHMARIGMDLRGVASFHGALGSFHTPAPGSVKAKVLVCHGGADALVTADAMAAFKAEMDQARADYRVEVYDGAMHAFTNPAATANGAKYGLPLAYNAAADEASWAHWRRFFQRALA